jgi:hypothetical protein
MATQDNPTSGFEPIEHTPILRLQGVLMGVVSVTIFYTVLFNWTVAGIAWMLYICILFAGGAGVIQAMKLALK